MLTALALLLQGLAAPVELTDRPLAGGERQSHTVALRSGDALRGQVVQRGIDVVVTVRRPGGSVAMEVDSPDGTDGPEPVALIASATGEYAVEVSALSRDAGAGRYDLRLDAVRPATRSDRAEAEALHLHLQAFAARNEGLEFLRQALFGRSAARYAAADRLGQKALRLREQVLGPNHYDVASTHQVLGLVDDEIGEYARGERHFARALEILTGLLGPDHPGLLSTQTDLGYLHLQTGDYKGAEALFARSLARREELFGPRSERLLADLGGLAEALLKQDQPARAEEMARRALGIETALNRPSPGRHASLGLILLAQERIREAEAECGQARAAAEAQGPSGRSQLSSALLCEGRVRQAAGDRPGAASLLAEALTIRESAVGPDHPVVAEVLTAQGVLLIEQGETKRARDVLQRALRIRERRLGPTIRDRRDARRLARA
jgi:tetratricopeptide (TPR) repeat protein